MHNNLVTVNREYDDANIFSLAWLFLNLSLFMDMEPGQSQPLSSSQAQASFGLPTSTLGARVQAVQYIICYVIITS